MAHAIAMVVAFFGTTLGGAVGGAVAMYVFRRPAEAFLSHIPVLSKL